MEVARTNDFWFARSWIFRLNVNLILVFNFIILLLYCAIHMFLVQKFSCSVATHGHEPSTYKNVTCELNYLPQ